MKNLFIFCLLCILILVLVACHNNEIIIGVSVSLTGANSAMGQAVIDGAVIAVDEINQQGGLNGKKITLLTRDDQNKPDTARKVDKELIEKGAVAIIGHLTSTISNAVLSQINQEKVILISPTLSSSIIHGDDYLISLNSANSDEQDLTAKYIFKTDNVKKLSIVFDSNNRVYAESWIQKFIDKYEQFGGDIIKILVFDSNDTTTDFILLAEDLSENEAEGVLIIASAINTVNIAQQLKKTNPDIKKYANGWAKEKILIEQGGEAVEGLVMTSKWNDIDDSQAFQRFKQRFSERYGRDPSFPAASAYECIMVLAEAIKSSNNYRSEQIFDTIIKTGKFDGISYDLLIDSNGATYREVYLFKVENGTYKLIKTE